MSAERPVSGPSATTQLRGPVWSLESAQRRRRIAALWTEETLLLDPTATCTVQVASAATTVPHTASRPRRLIDDGSTDQGDFVLRRVIGRGGVAMVYEAEQAGLGRTVAVKVQQREGHEEQFLAEAALIGMLEHPNVVPIYEVGNDARDGAFYAMRKVDGEDWAKQIDVLDRDRNLDVLLQVADAVAHAHERGILHCDLKPANVLLGPFGEVLVIDWGMAMAITDDGAKPVARDGSVGGTPAYMAPEQALADAASIGPWTDIYLLGGLLFRICTGKRPHAGADTRDCVEQASLNRIVPATDGDGLLAIAMQAMADEPDQRFASVEAFQQAVRDWRERGLAERLRATGRRQAESAKAGDFRAFASALFALEEAHRRLRAVGHEGCAGDLDRVRGTYADAAVEREDYALALGVLGDAPDDERIQSIVAARQARDRRQQRIRFVRLWLGVALLGLLVVLGVTGWVVFDQQQREQAAVAAMLVANQRTGLEADRQMLAAADAELTDERRDVARQLLSGMAASERGWAWRHLMARCVPDWVQIDVAEGILVTELSVSPDGSLVAALGDPDWVGIWSTADGQLRHRVQLSARNLHDILFSNDGSELYVADSNQFAVVDPQTGEIRRRYDLYLRDMVQIDDRRVVGRRQTKLLLFDVSTGTVIWEREVGWQANVIAVVGDRALLVHSGHVRAVPLQDPATEEEILYRQNCRYLHAHDRDGQPVYFVAYPNGSCGLVDPGRRGSPWLRMVNSPDAAAFSADGERFALIARELREVWLRSTYEYEEPLILRTPAPPRSVSFLAGATRLAVGMRDGLGIFDLASPAAPQAPPGLVFSSSNALILGEHAVTIDAQQMLTCAGVARAVDATVVLAEHDGPGFISGHADGTVRVWHPQLEEPMLVTSCGSSAVDGLAYAGDDLWVRLSDGSVCRLAGAEPAD